MSELKETAENAGCEEVLDTNTNMHPVENKIHNSHRTFNQINLYTTEHYEPIKIAHELRIQNTNLKTTVAFSVTNMAFILNSVLKLATLSD